VSDDGDVETRSSAAWRDHAFTEQLVESLVVLRGVMSVPRAVSTPVVRLSALRVCDVRVAFLCNAGVASLVDEPLDTAPAYAVRELHLDNNRVPWMPQSAAALLPSLDTLSLARNMLRNVESLAQFSRLRSLDLRHNHFEGGVSLAPLAACVAVEHLSLSSCALRSVASLPPLPRLCRLHLVTNALADLSECIAVLALQTALRHVDLDGNPLSHVRHQLRADGRVVTSAPADRHMFDNGIYYRAVLRRTLPALLTVDAQSTGALVDPPDLLLLDALV
jgi:hypothetical protein